MFVYSTAFKFTQSDRNETILSNRPEMNTHLGMQTLGVYENILLPIVFVLEIIDVLKWFYRGLATCKSSVT